MPTHYREIFATPGVKGLVATSSIVRLPQAMVSIGIVTMLVQQTGLYWLAGAVAGTFTLTNALLAQQVSKLVDRHGQSKVLPYVTAFSVAMLLALICAAYARAPHPLLFALAVLAGTMPSMPAMVRARWSALFRGTPQLHTAFSLESVLTELVYIIGPPLAIGLSISLFPEAGPLAAVALLVVGMPAFLMQRLTEPKVVVANREYSTSALRIPGLLNIVLALLMIGALAGAIDVAVVAFAHAQGRPTAASYILATYAFGSMLAGLVFGARRIAVPIERQFVLGILVTATSALFPILSPDVYFLAAALFVAGLTFAPTMIIMMNLGTQIVPPHRLTEGLTWMSTGISTGVAIGGALAGISIDAYGARAGFGVAIGAGLLLVVIAIVSSRTLRVSSVKHSELAL